jgi:hypothetical protein
MRACGSLLVAVLAAGCGGNAVPPGKESPPAARVEIRLRVGTLAPGAERERCRYLQLDNAEPLWVRRFELSATPGLHHSNVMALGGIPTEGEEPCFGFPDRVMRNAVTSQPRQLFASSSQVSQQQIELPPGVAVRIDPRQQVMFNYHYINVGEKAIEPEVVLDLTAIPESEVRHPATTWAFVNTDVHIPPRQGATLTTECVFPFDVQIVSIAPHMHRLGKRLRVEWMGGARDGEVLFESDRWDDPRAAIFDPILAFPSGQGMRFTCEWNPNPGDTEVTFGERYEDEMCIVFGYAVGEELILGGVAPEYGVRQCYVARGLPF